MLHDHKEFLNPEVSLTLATSWMRVATLRRASTSWLSAGSTIYFLHHFQEQDTFWASAGTFIPTLRMVKMLFAHDVGSNHSAHRISCPSVHHHCWITEAWRGDPVLSNSERKFELHSENVRNVHLRQKKLCYKSLKLQG